MKITVDGQITIRVLPASGDHVRFEVVETGTCTAPADRERLFEELRRKGPPSNRAFGVGLGISIARGLVEAMGGRIGAEMRPGRDSTSWFTVPLPVDWFRVAPPGAARRRGAVMALTGPLRRRRR